MNCIFLRRGYGEIENGNTMSDTFSENDWATIILACQGNAVPNTWAVGNSKTMTIGGADYQIDIIGKNHDTYSSGGTAPLTFQLHDCYGTKYQMYNSSSATAAVGWSNSSMRQTHLPSILTKMPSEVQTAIKEVNKKTLAANLSSTISTTSDKLFLLSEIEVLGSIANSKSGEGTQYAYYKNGGSKIKNFSGSASYWTNRSPNASVNNQFCAIGTGGSGATVMSTGSWGVSFAFCF